MGSSRDCYHDRYSDLEQQGSFDSTQVCSAQMGDLGHRDHVRPWYPNLTPESLTDSIGVGRRSYR